MAILEVRKVKPSIPDSVGYALAIPSSRFTNRLWGTSTQASGKLSLEKGRCGYARERLGAFLLAETRSLVMGEYGIDKETDIILFMTRAHVRSVTHISVNPFPPGAATSSWRLGQPRPC